MEAESNLNVLYQHHVTRLPRRNVNTYAISLFIWQRTFRSLLHCSCGVCRRQL